MVETLEALGKKDDAQDARWRYFEKYFEKSLNIERRAYLKRLPNFEDFEVERKAFEIAATHRSVDTALEFFVAWPNLQRADEIVRAREKEAVDRADDQHVAGPERSPAIGAPSGS
jgi:hypothetical protein